MAVTDCPTNAIPPQVLATMFERGIPTSLRMQADGSACAADVFNEIDQLWKQAITDCEKEKSK